MNLPKKGRKASVLFINRVYPPAHGATGRMVRDLARAFSMNGWDVTVLTCDVKSGKEKDGNIVIKKVKAPVFKKNRTSYLKVWCKLLLSGLFSKRHDLIISLTDPPMLVVAARIIASLKGSRHMHWCQDLYPDLFPVIGVKISSFWERFLNRLNIKSLKSCDRVVVIGRCMARIIMQKGIDAQKIAVIPNWPDKELAKKESYSHFNDAVSIERELEGVDGRPLFVDKEPKFRVLYAGNIGKAHPIETIIDAATMLSLDNPEIEFVFVGESEGHLKLARERARRGLDNIRFLPYQPVSRLKALMESGDIHIITMSDKAAGLLVPCKLYSALAAKRPCVLVGPNNCEIAKIIHDFRAGDVVAHGDAIALANVIRKYRNNGEEWYSAYEGASQAGRIFVPDESIAAWLQRARDVVLGRKKR